MSSCRNSFSGPVFPGSDCFCNNRDGSFVSRAECRCKCVAGSSEEHGQVSPYAVVPLAFTCSDLSGHTSVVFPFLPLAGSRRIAHLSAKLDGHTCAVARRHLHRARGIAVLDLHRVTPFNGDVYFRDFGINPIVMRGLCIHASGQAHTSRCRVNCGNLSLAASPLTYASASMSGVGARHRDENGEF